MKPRLLRARTGAVANQDEEKPMAKKSKAQEQGQSDEQLAGEVRDAAEKIWLAGLGAFAKSRGGNTKSFDALVREGEVLQSRTHSGAGASLHEAGSEYRRGTNHGSGPQATTCDRLEQVFEDRVARTLAHLGVPSASAIRELTVLLEALTDRIDMLDTMPTSMPATAAESATTETDQPAEPANPAKPAKATKAAKAAKAKARASTRTAAPDET
jgi:poly(hydroxyalkanoate) granule-associated protein